MWQVLRELMRGMKSGFQEFHRSSEEIQDEMNRAMEVRPPDESDRRMMRNLILSFALLCYTLFWLSLFRTV
jgi:hypothetical protein